MADPQLIPQDFQSAPPPKRKRGTTTGTNIDSTPISTTNRFAVLSDSEPEEDTPPTHTQTTEKPQRIPPIVVYSLLHNHTSTLKKVNEKLLQPVIVKAKPDRLLMYTKSPTDYSTLLTEIKSANLTFHTYPLPDTVHPRLVIKGLPSNILEEDIKADLAAYNVPVTKVTQITKTDKQTHKIITKYPIFVISFPPNTDLRPILQITKICYCLITWDKYKPIRPLNQCYNCQAFGHSSYFCGKPPRCVKCDLPHATKDCRKT